MKVHPIAEMFPMMTDDELNELAQDIKENGLLNPIVKDKDGVLIDGRNRLEACKRAKVEPSYEVLNGQDAVTFILSQNNKRRHLNPGQRAMIAALAWVSENPEKEKDKGGRPKKTAPIRAVSLRDAAKHSGVGQTSIFRALDVIEYNEADVEQVRCGGMKLNKAHVTAMANKKARESWRVQFEQLPQDLRERVEDEDDDLDLEGAVAEVKKRDKIAQTHGLINDHLREYIKAPQAKIEEARAACLEALGKEYDAAEKKGKAWTVLTIGMCIAAEADKILGETKRDHTGYAQLLSRMRQIAEFVCDMELIASAQKAESLKADMEICQHAIEKINEFMNASTKGQK
jgi:hypothetical protein